MTKSPTLHGFKNLPTLEERKQELPGVLTGAAGG